MKNKNLFVPLEIAKKLKELGFSESCFKVYYISDNDKPCLEYLTEDTIGGYYVNAPIYQQVIDWFEENHKIIVGYELSSYSLRSFKENGNPSYKFKTKVFSFINGEEGGLKDFDSKIDALNEAILHGLNLIK